MNFRLIFKQIFLFLLILGLASCSSFQSIDGKREPASKGKVSAIAGDSCQELISPLLDDSFVLSKEDWDPDLLFSEERIRIEDFEEMRENPDWQRFISRPEQTDEEREMSYVILSLLKKRFHPIADDRLKDRYRVFMAFCGT